MNQLVQFDENSLSLTSKRLSFRLPTSDDLSLLMQHMSPDIAANVGSIPWPYKIDDASYFICLKRGMDSRLDYLIHTIAHRQFIGVVSLHLDEQKRGEVGYWITENQRSNHYATESAETICDLAVLLGLNKIWMSIRPSNVHSISIAKKIGLHFSKECVHQCRNNSMATFYIYEKSVNNQ